MNARYALALAGLTLPTIVLAQERAHLDVYYIPSAEVEVTVPDLGGGDDDGDGFGAKVLAPLPISVRTAAVLVGEYQSSSYDDTDLDLDQMRIGGGIQSMVLQGGLFTVYGEYANFDFDDAEADGFGIHGRLAFPIADSARLFGQIGYLTLEEDDAGDLDGFEWLIGGEIDFMPNLGAFVDLRQTKLEDDFDIEYEFTDIRIGVNIRFGA